MLSSSLRSSAAAASATRCLSGSFAVAATAVPSSCGSAVLPISVFSRTFAGMAGRDVRMHVLLTENHSKLGLKGDAIAVKRGYGRNVLIRQGRAVYATEENKQMAQLKAQARAASEKQDASSAASSAAASSASSATASSSATATASSSSPSSSSSTIDNLRYQLDLSHRLQGAKIPVFHRTVSGRSDVLTQPITTKDLYRKLVKGFPSLTLKQITFTGGASSVEKLGDFLADVALPGLTAPVQIKFRIQKMATPGVGTGVVSAVQQKVAAAPPAQSQSIKA